MVVDFGKGSVSLCYIHTLSPRICKTKVKQCRTGRDDPPGTLSDASCSSREVEVATKRCSFLNSKSLICGGLVGLCVGAKVFPDGQHNDTWEKGGDEQL